MQCNVVQRNTKPVNAMQYYAMPPHTKPLQVGVLNGKYDLAGSEFKMWVKF